MQLQIQERLTTVLIHELISLLLILASEAHNHPRAYADLIYFE
jgi:hypothetical protein